MAGLDWLQEAERAQSRVGAAASTPTEETDQEAFRASSTPSTGKISEKAASPVEIRGADRFDTEVILRSKRSDRP